MNANGLLTDGDIIELHEGHKVYADVPEHYVYGNREGVFTLTHHDVTIGGDLLYLAGRYVVYKTTTDGGSSGLNGRDGYPSGHHVFCERLDNRAVRVDFYQTGCFTAMIPSITPVGRAERQWVEA